MRVYGWYVRSSGRFILSQRSAIVRALAAALVLLPWLWLLGLCVVLLAQAMR